MDMDLFSPCRHPIESVEEETIYPAKFRKNHYK